MTDGPRCEAGVIFGAITPFDPTPDGFDPGPAAQSIRLQAEAYLHHPGDETVRAKLSDSLLNLHDLSKSDPLIAEAVMREMTRPDAARVLPVATLAVNEKMELQNVSFAPGCLDPTPRAFNVFDLRDPM